MTNSKLFGAAVVLATLVVSPASAQHMIDEPGMFAFVYPNGDLGIGSARPPADALAMAPRPMVRRHVAMKHDKSK